ncbi:MAG: release factor glutamine methyltransferase [Rickettsiales bacterium]|jgi:release factor glutamine methyltransferase
MNLTTKDSIAILNKNVENILSLSNIPLPKIESNILISRFLNLSKEDIILKGRDIYPDKKSLENIKIALQRRLSGEPISHIIGKREFYSIDFDVNQNVLDPRPDSELLIDEVLTALNGGASEKSINILELGVGSGCLVLSILKNIPNSRAVGVDINTKSINVAKKNAIKLNLNNRVQFVHSDWFENLERQKFDIIISNPPYIKSKDIDNLQTEIKNFEPMVALDGGSDGLNCYREIAENIGNFLHEKSFLILEIGVNMEDDVINIFEKQKLQLIKYSKDFNSIIRCLMFVKQ